MIMKSLLNQYLKDFLDLILIITDEENLTLNEALALSEVKEIIPSNISKIDNEVIVKIIELYNTQGFFDELDLYTLLEELQDLEPDEAILKLKFLSNHYIYDTLGIKN